jgi:UDP-MurNAc hydroxylase
MSDEILWINHAGYELRSSGLRIVHDPWLEGMAFGEGWALVSESRYTAEDFDGVDYIWFSHEHPDHFAPGVLKSIPEEVRRRITVLFQQTRDGRVVGFCRRLGFQIRELPDAERVLLSPEVFVTCGTANNDSWLFVETPEHTYFNANDVVGIDWAPIKAALKRPVDVLLTQFSYASWVGNPGDDERMAAQAALKFQEMDQQIETFNPRILIPFASYVWFCREENFHLNAAANRIDRVYSRYEDRIETVVLYPGDRYQVGEGVDSSLAIARYVADWQRHDRPLAITDVVLSMEELEQLSEKHQQKLHDSNWMWLLQPLRWTKFVRPVAIYLKDLQIGMRYSMFGGILKTGVLRGECEIEMSSASFANLLRNGYGYGTLAISGRFLELRPEASLRLSRHFAIPAQNEQGFGVPGVFLRREYVLGHLRRRRQAALKRIRAALPTAGRRFSPRAD